MGRRAPAFKVNMGALLAGLLSGVIASMGMGGGAVLLIYLTVFLSMEQLAAQGINLIFFIPIGLMSVIIYSVKKKIKFKKILPIAAAGIVGSFLGLQIISVIDKNALSKIFAVFLIFLGAVEFFKKDKNRT